MSKVYEGKEFEALICRFKDQAELLYRLTLVDLKVFTGYITLQLVLGAWMAVHNNEILELFNKTGLLIIDFVLSFIAIVLLYKNYKRRQEVAKTIGNCNKALGYESPGVYLYDERLNAKTESRPWFWTYFVGIIFGFIGIIIILFGNCFC